MFAASCCQCDALNLNPRQELPMHANDERPSDASPSQAISSHGSCGAGSSRPGLSEFEPDPIRALEKARLEATRR